MAERVDRVERMTNLLALLLETPEPISLRQITHELEGQYPSAATAQRGAFERDKAALRAIGVPIESEVVTGPDDPGQTRYWIDRAAYELAGLDLEPDEMRALQVAVAAVRSDAGQDAIWKLGGTVDAERPPVSAAVPDRPELPLLRSAVASRSTISFTYRGERRTLDPWGLLLRGGFWYVLGHDHLREDRRTFRVDRFEGGVEGIEVGDPGAFERPAGFDPRDAFPADPKQIGHAPTDGVEALVAVDAVRAAAVERELGAARVQRRHPDGTIDVRVPATNLDAFRSWVLGLLDHAVVLEPAGVRDDIVAWLDHVVAEGAR